MAEGIVSIHQLATFFDVTPKTVRNYVEAGMPQESKGRYDILRASAWLIRDQRRQIARRTTGGDQAGSDEALRRWRAEQAQAEAELKMMDVAERRGTMIPVVYVIKVWNDAIERFRARMLASISAESARILGLKSQAKAHGILEEIIHAALSEIAKAVRELEHPNGNGKPTK